MVAIAVAVGVPLGILLAVGLWRDAWGAALGRPPGSGTVHGRAAGHGLAVAVGALVGSYLGPYHISGEPDLRQRELLVTTVEIRTSSDPYFLRSVVAAGSSRSCSVALVSGIRLGGPPRR